MFGIRRAFVASPLSRSFAVKAGDKFPAGITVFDTPGSKLSSESLAKGKKVIVFGVPGAYTPTCSATHLPGFVKKFDEFKTKGVDSIVCVSVNDPFVMKAWGEQHKVDGKVKMIADPDASLTKALGVEHDFGHVLGVRGKRFSLLLENGVVKQINVEPATAPGGTSCTLAEQLKI